MRLLLLVLTLCLGLEKARADGFTEELKFPVGISVSERRSELLANLPFLEDSTRRSSITSYRQNLNRFNAVFIVGLYEQIKEICRSLNDYERKVNKRWSEGSISGKEKSQIDENIRSERMNCSDRFARTSPYFELYYEIIDRYRELDEDSVVILSECNSRDSCRNS